MNIPESDGRPKRTPSLEGWAKVLTFWIDAYWHRAEATLRLYCVLYAHNAVHALATDCNTAQLVNRT